MIRLLDNDKGMALPLVFVVMMIVISFAGAMLTLSNTEMKISTNDYNGQKALYLADAGINYSIKLIDKNELNKVPYKFNLDAGQEVKIRSVVKNASKWQVEAEGKSNKILKVLAADIELLSKENPLDELKSLQIGLLEGGEINYGKIGNYDDKGNGYVTGNVYYSDNKPTNVNFASEDYGVYENQDAIFDYITEYGKHVSSMTPVSKLQIEQTSNNFLNTSNGMYYYDGQNGAPNITGSITYTGKSILYIKGDLYINGSIQYPGTNSNGAFLLIIVDGNVFLKANNNEQRKFVLCAKTIEFDNANSEFEGVLVASNILLSNAKQNFYNFQPSVVHNIDLKDLQLNKQYKISNWHIVQ